MELTTKKILSKILQGVLKFIYPPLCVNCKEIISKRDSLCPKCWSKLKFIQNPCCNICSTPLKYKISENDICPSCIRKTPLYTQAKAIFAYNDTIAKLIFGFKYYDKTYLSKFLAKMMFDYSKDIFDNIDIIIPAPLHKNRLQFRKYNQAALLVKAIAKLSKKEFVLDLLQRQKDVIPQVRLKGKDRMQNLKKVFCVNPKYLSNKNLSSIYEGKSFLLIDDVMTTGTTVNECTKVLLNKGARSVYVLTISKTVLRD